MQIRITGTLEECSRMAAVIRNNVPERYLRSISGFYPNRRKTTFSNEGRVYVNFADLPADGELLPVVRE